MSRYPENKYRDEPEDDLHDVTDVTLNTDRGGAHGTVVAQSRRKALSRSLSKLYRYKKPLILAAAAALVFLITLIVVVIALSGGNDSGEPEVGVTLPTVDVPVEKLGTNQDALVEILITRYSARGMDIAPLKDPETFQGRALEYVAGSELFEQLTPDKNVERYAAVVFYLSTNRQPHLLNKSAEPWVRSQNWLTRSEICLWEGIECDVEEKIVGIVLPENKMSGMLPLELSLLEHLAKIDFTSNLIYMDKEYHRLWSLLPNLRQLLMDDNFFISETGIPVEFAELSSIEKISLSFNLLQGTFSEGIFGSMTTLLHFEAESNYVSGPLPNDFLTLPKLTYIYIRRNSLEIPLIDVFSTGNLPSLFALWLDGNIVGGRIPASIGQFSGIASLSITGAQLTGPIPTEMALLTDLQRLWLYDNQLTGSIPPNAAAAWTKLEVFEVYGNELNGVMPASICAAVDTSDYELATLSADCQEVKCDDCCTECY